MEREGRINHEKEWLMFPCFSQVKWVLFVCEIHPSCQIQVRLTKVNLAARMAKPTREFAGVGDLNPL